jgi:SAM-dependent methyltransferase
MDFAARKLPSRQHFRIVECRQCGLVYSNPVLPPDAIRQLYRHSPFLQEAQLDGMVRDYLEQVRAVLPSLGRHDRLLEIGCSGGYFLQAARDLGFREVWGVEPGESAVRQAPASIRPRIVNDFFHAGLFPPASFDLICGFQVLDHLLDPAEVLRDVWRLLRPGGLALFLNHNIRSWLPRLLGERSPMYDVEHIYLFDSNTVARILRKHGFEVVSVANTRNSYTLGYAIKMFPLPQLLKVPLGALARACGIDNWRVRLAAGNMVAVGRKPDNGAAAPSADATTREGDRLQNTRPHDRHRPSRITAANRHPSDAAVARAAPPP